MDRLDRTRHPDGERILVGKEASAHPLKHGKTDNLAVKERDLPDRDRRKAVLNHLPVPALDMAPLGKIAVLKLTRKNAIADDRIGHVAIEVEIGQGPLRLLNDHLLRIEDQ